MQYLIGILAKMLNGFVFIDINQITSLAAVLIFLACIIVIQKYRDDKCIVVAYIHMFLSSA